MAAVFGRLCWIQVIQIQLVEVLWQQAFCVTSWASRDDEKGVGVCGVEMFKEPSDLARTRCRKAGRLLRRAHRRRSHGQVFIQRSSVTGSTLMLAFSVIRSHSQRRNVGPPVGPIWACHLCEFHQAASVDLPGMGHRLGAAIPLCWCITADRRLVGLVGKG